MPDDPELQAISAIMEALGPLDEPARARVIEWAARRFDVAIAPKRAAPHTRTLSRTSNPGGNELDEDVGESVEFVDLFDNAGPSSEPERALLGGYWFQVARGHGDFQAQEVNNALKDLGHGVGNITVAFTSLQQRSPALVRQVAKSGRTKQARKRYKLTSAGISAVQAMLGQASGGE